MTFIFDKSFIYNQGTLEVSFIRAFWLSNNGNMPHQVRRPIIWNRFTQFNFDALKIWFRVTILPSCDKQCIVVFRNALVFKWVTHEYLCVSAVRSLYEMKGSYGDSRKYARCSNCMHGLANSHGVFCWIATRSSSVVTI